MKLLLFWIIFGWPIVAAAAPLQEVSFERRLEEVFGARGFTVTRLPKNDISGESAWWVFDGKPDGVIQGSNGASTSYRRTGKFNGVYFFLRDGGKHLLETNGIKARYDFVVSSAADIKKVEVLLRMIEM
jgi:hypothetical protein